MIGRRLFCAVAYVRGGLLRSVTVRSGKEKRYDENLYHAVVPLSSFIEKKRRHQASVSSVNEQTADLWPIVLLVVLAALRDAVSVDRNAAVLITVFAASSKALEKQK